MSRRGSGRTAETETACLDSAVVVVCGAAAAPSLFPPSLSTACALLLLLLGLPMGDDGPGLKRSKKERARERSRGEREVEYELGESAAAAAEAAAEKIRKTFSSVRLYELELGNVVKTRLARLRSLRTAAVWRFALLSLPHLYEALRLPPCTFALPVWNTKM